VLCLTVNYWWLNIQGDSGGKVNILEVIISVIVGDGGVHINTRIAVIQLVESPYLTLLDFFVCGVGLRANFTKEKWIRETNCLLAVWMLLPALRNMKINSDEQHAIFAQDMQSALK